MQINLPLEKMTISEKIDTMEIIWNSLCRDENTITSPFWHGEILAQREDSAKDEDFLDWECSKKQIFSQLSES